MSIDLEFRPASYSDFDNPVALALSGINGQMRREMVRDMLTAEGKQRREQGLLLGPIQEAILEEQADASFIDNLSNLGGPSWMGGEYLPQRRRQEVEIARIVLQSTLMDVISLRARWAGGRYHYQVVDEYDGTFTLCRKTSRQTLTLAQVIKILQTGYENSWNSYDLGLVECWWHQQLDSDWHSLDECTDFAWVESELYPGLSAWYEERAEEWKRQRRAELDEDNETI